MELPSELWPIQTSLQRMNFFSIVGCNVENVPRPELQQNILPGYTSHRGTAPVRPDSIQICDGSASRSEFQERISHGGNMPGLQFQNFTQSVTSTKFHGGNAPGPSNSAKIQGGKPLDHPILPSSMVEMPLDHQLPIRLVEVELHLRLVHWQH